MEGRLVKQLKGRWAYTLSENPEMYEVVGYRGMSGDMLMRRLFDKNRIKMK